MQEESHKPKVGISVGDLGGIGCEVILKTFQDSRMLDFCTPVIFASGKTLSHHMQQLDLQLKFQGVQDAASAIDGRINVVNIWKDHPLVPEGKATAEGGTYAIKSLRAAVKALREGDVDVLVTAPINKKNVQNKDFQFPGHTDYLAQELGGESLMFMVTDSLKVGLLTDHVPVREAPELITQKRITAKLKAMEESLIRDFAIRKPRIAVLGINPHSGDEGVIGKEDDEVLKPALKKLIDAGHLVFGPYAADTFFASDNYRNFDAVLAAYHDQGLIPFKTLSFGKGVNFTAGLSRIRTSPDHGTAYDIAGKGMADSSSFTEAVFSALEIFRNRTEYEGLTKNPLQKVRLKRNTKGKNREK
ncbi:4-hydroxythreonine-4-phosphate dehydrogenase PdxA [Robiginitalea sp. M366]|uniref:4-hydroxythreonine-4-phosphate dehydrogenase PdxA n=1 Tax=Robiginitalea aestuariiviva TaxID=3036903 RepID=UPI00240E1446|nr:4-hydroxythreonine-4-phosphate dehydrogenase PdxA [Robiginitalea aestuariiviva]MDG1571570.1 4-hydroxythreonine-4-phosphate dehydrogenase PdxA [Robiginitalea aestuariiviva]